MNIFILAMLTAGLVTAQVVINPPRDPAQLAADEAERLVAQAAISNSLTAPQSFPLGLESPSIALVKTNGSAIGIAVTPSMDVIGFLDHASPRGNWQARRDAAIDSNEVRVSVLRALKNSPEWAKFETNKVQYATHQTQYLNQTNNLTANQLKPVDKAEAQIDDIFTMLKQLHKMVKDLADNQ